MGKYVFGFNETSALGTQVDNMWNFLTATHKCARPGTVVSWVADCTNHHFTRSYAKWWGKNETPSGEPSIPDSISAMDFVHNFLYGVPLDPANPEKYHFWYDDRADQMSATSCSGSDIPILTTNGAMLSSPVSGLVTVAVSYILSLAWM